MKNNKSYQHAGRVEQVYCRRSSRWKKKEWSNVWFKEKLLWSETLSTMHLHWLVDLRNRAIGAGTRHSPNRYGWVVRYEKFSGRCFKRLSALLTVRPPFHRRKIFSGHLSTNIISIPRFGSRRIHWTGLTPGNLRSAAAMTRTRFLPLPTNALAPISHKPATFRAREYSQVKQKRNGAGS